MMNKIRYWWRELLAFLRLRKLRATYTTEMVEELEILHGIDVEGELAAILSEEINKEMILEHGENWKEEQDDAIITAIKKIAKEQDNDNNKTSE